MNKQCPSWQSTKIYRCHSQSWEVCCDNCNHRWQAKQVLAPIIHKKFWLNQPFERLELVDGWRLSSNSQTFAYQLAYSASLFFELKGKFDKPDLALEAGIKDANGLLVQTSIALVKPKH